MDRKGQKYRKAGEDGVWEVLNLRQGPNHEGEWFLCKIGGGTVESVLEQDLESGFPWLPAPDDA